MKHILGYNPDKKEFKITLSDVAAIHLLSTLAQIKRQMTAGEKKLYRKLKTYLQ